MNTNLEQLINQQDTIRIQAKKKLVLKSFWDFCIEVLDYQNLNDFHFELCSFTQRWQRKKRLVLLPRGHLKSTIVTVAYSLWRLAQDQTIRILISNATAPMAEAFLRQIKAHIQYNKRFIELFGNLHKQSEKWSDGAIRLSQAEAYKAKENTVTAFGIGGSLVSQHYDLMIFDDLVNRDNTHTQERIADVKTFYQDAQDLVDDPMKTEQIMIGTRWHEGDLYGDILDPENPERIDWKVMKREAIEGDYQILKNDKGRYEIEGGTVIYDKFPRIALNKLINSKGLSNFSAQYLNDPVPADQATFKHEFKYYEPEDIKGWEFNNFIAVDPAFFDPAAVKKGDPDYTAFVVVRVNYVNDWYVVDCVNERMSPDEIINMMFELDTKYKPKTIGLETTSFQKILGYTTRAKMKEKNHFLPITELSHAGRSAQSKFDRIQGLEPRYATGTIFHNRQCRYINVLENQLKRFPRAKNDDLSDALASILEIAYAPRRKTKRGYGDGDGVSKDNWDSVSYPA